LFNCIIGELANLIFFELEVLVDAMRVDVNEQQLTDTTADTGNLQVGSLVTVHHTLDLYMSHTHTSVREQDLMTHSTHTGSLQTGVFTDNQQHCC